jgi:dihydrofolate synthase / folylpolyglutamate synthase
MSPTIASNPTYEDAIAHLSALIPELSTATGPAGSPPLRRKFSLIEIGALSAALGNPHTQFPAVLVAGTNGKGSTASTLASIARAAGLRVGLYTSPHLERVNERIRLYHQGGPGLASETWVSAPTTDIPDQTFARLYFRVEQTAQQLVSESRLPAFPSYFELLTALAFLYFAESKIDLAVLEVGMGGRLDATNLVHPILSVITDISLDHQEWLGSTIDLIAREKAGILRPNGTLITLPQHPEANQALGEVATELNVRAISASDYVPSPHTNPAESYPVQVLGTEILVDSPLKGAHQHRNIALAIASAVELAKNHSFPITPAAIAQGICATDWPGRLERIALPNQPEFILDVAHNPAGAWALRSALNTSQSALGDADTDVGAPSFSRTMRKGWETSNPDQNKVNVLIFACLRDKPLREMTQILFPLFDHVILAPIHSPRATEVADLLAAAEDTGVPSTPAATVAEAIQTALKLNPARIVISGSVYLVGEARALLLHHKAQTL